MLICIPSQLVHICAPGRLSHKQAMTKQQYTAHSTQTLTLKPNLTHYTLKPDPPTLNPKP